MNLEGVEKTMLLTLFAKAQHSQAKNHKFYDEKAIEVISKIDYDFTTSDKDLQMKYGVISRTIVLDEMVLNFLKKILRQQSSILLQEWIQGSTDLITAWLNGTILIWKTPQNSDSNTYQTMTGSPPLLILQWIQDGLRR